MFIAALIIMTKEWKQSKFPSPDEWINKWYIHTMKYNSAIKSNEVLKIHGTTWINLESIVLSERSQSQRITFCMILFI